MVAVAEGKKEKAGEQLAIERLRVFGNVITVVITVGVGTFGVAWMNADYQERQLKQQAQQNEAALALEQERTLAEIRKAEMGYLGAYVEYALEERVEKRIRFAEYFATLTVSEELGHRWMSYRDQLRGAQESERALAQQIVEAAARGEVERAADLNVKWSDLVSSTDQFRPPTEAEYEARYPSIRTSELDLAREGEAAFLRGDFEWAIKFLEQAHRVQSSGVWQSSYPYLIGAYLETGRPDDADRAAKTMLSSMLDTHGYLANATTQGFVLQGLGEIRARVQGPHAVAVDQLIDDVIAVKEKTAMKRP